MPLRRLSEEEKNREREARRRQGKRRKQGAPKGTARKPSLLAGPGQREGRPTKGQQGGKPMKSKPRFIFSTGDSFLNVAKKEAEQGGSPKLKTGEDIFKRASNKYYGQVRSRFGDNAMKKGGMNKMLSGGQAKIAAKAPPPDKIDEKDFAVLREEKAKGRGMGLQDEKVKPGKVMKANLGILAMKKAKDKGAKGAEFLSPIMLAKKMFNKKKGGVMKARAGKMFTKEQKQKYPGLAKAKSASEFLKRRKELTGHGKMTFDQKMKAQDQGLINKKTGAGAKDLMKRAASVTLGKRLLLPVAAGVATVSYLKKKMKEKKENKKMGGGMMKRPMGYTKGGGADQTKMEKLKFSLDKNIKGLKDKRKAGLKVKETVRTYALANSMKDQDRLTERDVKKARELVKGKMGGGMIGSMQKPMGYSKGKSIKVKCKLGRNKPTKMY